jgi:deoxyribonuclease V
VDLTESWPTTVEEARAVQDLLRADVDLTDSAPTVLQTVAGLDVAYIEDSCRAVAAVVVVSYPDLTVVDQSVVVVDVPFPYIPGLFAFREVPPLVDALCGLSVTPDALVCDGYGIAHPRRFGLACHLGVVTGLPAIGVGKTMFVGTYPPVASERGSWSEISDQGEVVGRAVRTRSDVKPVFVSVGHRIGIGRACDLVLNLCHGYRLPETTRLADRLAREAGRRLLGAS